MIKNLIVTGWLCLISMPIFAQHVKLDFNKNKEPDERVSPLYKEKTEQYAIEIREIVIREKLAMETEISKVDDDLKNGNISDSLAGNLKADIALRFSERIDSGIGSLKFDLDEAVKKQVQYSIMNTDVEKLKEEQAGKTEEWHYKPQNYFGFYFSFGMIHLPDGKNDMLNKHLGYSSGIDFGMIYHRQLSATSPWIFQTGLYASSRTIRFDDDYLINRNSEGDVHLLQHEKNLKTSKLRVHYLTVPLGIKYNFTSLKTATDNSVYRDVEKGMAIGLNFYGGFRISNINIVKGEDVSYRDKDTNYKLNNLIYGVQLNLTLVNDINLFVRQDLNSYFKDGVFDDRRMLQFGINLGF